MLYARNKQGQASALVGAMQNWDCWCLGITALCRNGAIVQFVQLHLHRKPRCVGIVLSQLSCGLCGAFCSDPSQPCGVNPAQIIGVCVAPQLVLSFERKDGFHSWLLMPLLCVSFIVLSSLWGCSALH